MLARAIGCCALSLTATAVSARAKVDGEWTATSLHPPGTTFSYAQGTSGTQQVGWVHFGGHSDASLWSATAAS